MKRFAMVNITKFKGGRTQLWINIVSEEVRNNDFNELYCKHAIISQGKEMPTEIYFDYQLPEHIEPAQLPPLLIDRINSHLL